MALIAEDVIEELKQNVSVQRLVEEAGIKLKKSGKDWIGRCPFHEDNEPSLVVTPLKNLWHCFGCQVGGGPIDWVMKIKGVSFRHAVELLKADPSLAAGEVEPVKRTTVRSLPPPVAFDTDDQRLLNETIDYYHSRLKQSPEALSYLESRGLVHPELIDRFKLGLADRSLGLRLPHKRTSEGAKIRGQLTKIGLYRESGHEHFNGSLVIPVFDEFYNVVEVYGRKIRDDLRPGTPKHLYLPGPHRGVFNELIFTVSKEIILCESLIDALTFWCAGYRNVTSAFGIEGFTDDLFVAFKRHQIERILIAYDADDAGNQATEKLAERLISEGFAVFRIRLPKGMDVNEYALKVAPAHKSLGLLIRRAEWLGQNKAPERIIEASLSPSLAAKENSEEVLKSSSPMEEKVDNAEPPLPAERIPAKLDEFPVEVEENEVRISLGDRRYRVRGFAKNTSPEILKVNLMASIGEHFHTDSIDLYSAKARAAFVHQAAIELLQSENVLRADLGKVLLKLESIQDERLRAKLEVKVAEAITMTAEDREAALSLLCSPNLIEQIQSDFDAIGLVGEGINKLVGYLAATSRKLDAPLAIVVQSTSAAGKSSLMDAVLSLMPEEERIQYSAMTGQSLFYMGATNLKHKILAIVEEEGASRASYALKLLQSEGELTIASTGKDPTTGNLVTQEYHVEGPVMIFLTTTAIQIDEELLNRCLVLSIDEGRGQTQAIHRLQREKRTHEGLIARAKREAVLQLHRNAQRLLQPLAVMNPFARELRFPDTATRMRRDHEKYLTLIDSIALLHQYQRPVKRFRVGAKSIDYIEVTISDIQIANRLAHEVLGRSLDELPPQTRRLLQLTTAFVNERAASQQIEGKDVRFTRRELREAVHWGNTQLVIHLERLIELEYIVTKRDGAGGKFFYELIYDGDSDNSKPHLTGLIDTKTLQQPSTTEKFRDETDKFRGEEDEVSGRFRGDIGPIPGRFRGEELRQEPHDIREEQELDAMNGKNAYLEGFEKERSHVHEQSYRLEAN